MKKLCTKSEYMGNKYTQKEYFCLSGYTDKTVTSKINKVENNFGNERECLYDCMQCRCLLKKKSFKGGKRKQSIDCGKHPSLSFEVRKNSKSINFRKMCQGLCRN